jgi:hypothetical protein
MISLVHKQPPQSPNQSLKDRHVCSAGQGAHFVRQKNGEADELEHEHSPEACCPSTRTASKVSSASRTMDRVFWATELSDRRSQLQQTRILSSTFRWFAELAKSIRAPGLGCGGHGCTVTLVCTCSAFT